MNFLSKKEVEVKKSFIKPCYEVAEEDRQMLDDCSLMENDVLYLMWEDLDVIQILNANRVKYQEEKGNLP